MRFGVLKLGVPTPMASASRSDAKTRLVGDEPPTDLKGQVAKRKSSSQNGTKLASTNFRELLFLVLPRLSHGASTVETLGMWIYIRLYWNAQTTPHNHQ